MKTLQYLHLYGLGSLPLALPCMSCRLCLDGGEEKELLTPCACRGSAGHVHAECLLEWCDHVGEYKKCDVCHQRLGCKEVFYIFRLKFPKFHFQCFQDT